MKRLPGPVHPLLPGGHLQSIVPTLWPRRPSSDRWEPRIVRLGEHDALLTKLHPGGAAGSLVLVHGLGGSAESGYLVALTAAARARGLTVLRVNLRSSGGSERLSRTLPNAGRSDDLGAVLEVLADELPRPVGVVGFSLGGNLTMRYVARAGDACRADAAVAVNPPLDLDACLSRLERGVLRPYDRFYVVKVCRQLEAIRRVREVPGPVADPWKIGGLRRFDDLFTAPDGGYPSSVEYYADASAGPLLGGVRRPSLVLTAVNDPVVDWEIVRSFVGERVELLVTERGGHCGYWQTGATRFWAAGPILDWLERALRAPQSATTEF